MTQHSQQIQRRAAEVFNSDMQPIFFFDGNFRTWAEVERRAQLNATVARLIGNSRTG